MGCPKSCAAQQKPRTRTRARGSKTRRSVPGAATPNRQSVGDKQAYKNNRLDYHAAGSGDVCRFNTRM